MRINKGIYLVAIGALLASCQSVETPMFSDKDAFVAFDSKTLSISENANKEIQIPISLVASKSLDVSVNFEVDVTGYDEKSAAKPGVHYNLKTTESTITFKANEPEMVKYIVIEPIDNDTYDGDVYLNLRLSSPNGCNLGANYNLKITITDDDHPLAAAGILGTYNATGESPFQGYEGVVYNWTCEVQKDDDFVDRVWFTQILPTVSGVTFPSVMGRVSSDFRTITIDADQSLGSAGEGTTLVLTFNGAASVDAQVNNGTISINTFVLASIVEQPGYAATGVKSVTMTKVE